MSSKIDILLEKFLMAYDWSGHYEEVFINPTSQEMREVFRASNETVGVIMDRKNDKIYVFNRDRQIHSQAWRKFGDGRKLYRTDDLLTAEYPQGDKYWSYGSQRIFTDLGVLRNIKKADWSFFKKWIPTITEDVRELL